MRLSIKEKMNRIIAQQKAMLASGEKYRPLIENRVQRIAVRLMVIFFTVVFFCTMISHVSHSITTASVSVTAMTSGALTKRAEAEGTIQAAADKRIPLPEGLKVVEVNAEKGSRVNEGEALLAFDIPSLEEQLKKLEYEIHILTLKIQLSESGSGNDVITAQHALEDAQKAYERLAAKYNRTDARWKEDYTKREEELTDAENKEDRTIAVTRQELIERAEAVVKEAEENLENVKEAAESAIYAAEKELDDASETLDASKNAYQQALERYKQAESDLNDAQQTVSDIENEIAGQDPDDSNDYTEALNEAKKVLSMAQEAFERAKKDLSEAEYKTSSYDSASENLNAVKERWKNKTDRAAAALNDAKAVLTEAEQRTDFSNEAAVIEAQEAIEAAKGALNNSQREFEDNQYLGEEELYTAQRAIEAAQIALENAQRQAAVSQKEGEITRLTCEFELAEKEKLRNMLQDILDNKGYFPSPASGTVLSTMEKGSKTEADEGMVILSCDDRGFIFEGVLDIESAQHFSAGDKGELHYILDGSTQKAEAEIQSIRTSDEENTVIVTAILPEGSYPAGVPAQISLNKKSGNYDSCLPITALRSDSGGDHVFVLRKQNSVMGTEWVTSRIDITIKDRDSQMMSIESMLTYSDQVITGSDKTISEGDRVRIEN